MAASRERPYRGMTAEARRADRRRRLLDAALELFGTRGYGATTIEELCAEAGVTARHFYEHFSSREDLLLALYLEIVEEHLGGLAGSLPPDGDLEQVVRTGAEVALTAWVDDVRRARIAFAEIVGVSERLEEHRLAVLDEYARFIAAAADDLAARGLIEPRDRTLVGVALVGAITQLLVHWLNDPEPPPIETVIDALTDMQIGLLRYP